MANNWTAASIQSLMEIRDVNEELAAKIRKVWKAGSQDELDTLYPDVEGYCRGMHTFPPRRMQKRWIIDQLVGTYGVEHLGFNKRSCEHVYYCNAGDLYASTILFAGRSLKVGCCADLIERNLIQEGQSA